METERADRVQETVFLSPADVALRASVSRKTVYRAIRSRELVAARIGSIYRITEEDFWRWIERSRGRPSDPPIEASKPVAPVVRGSLVALRAIEDEAA